MKIYLLTHERELNRPTNTGSLATESCEGFVKRVTWQRRHPDQELAKLLTTGLAALVYPETEARLPGKPVSAFDTFVLLDGTWQEARKMYNQSPYLKSASKVELLPEAASEYGLRRNQRSGGLCTAECIVELLRYKGFCQQAELLLEVFRKFNQR